MTRKGKGKRPDPSHKGVVKSEKKKGLHKMNQLSFKSRAQEKMYNKLAIEFVERHLPKIMDIVPSDVREKRGESHNTPGKLYKDVLQTVATKNTYVKRIKTFIKWHVVEKGINSLGQIDKRSTDEFFTEMAKDIGTGKDEYSKKTYDSYVDGTYKMFQALSTTPGDAKVQLEGREYGKPIQSAKALLNRDYKNELRNKVGKYSKEEYKRGSGYTSSQASTIMRQVEKHMDTRTQLLVATLVYGGARNDEAQQFTLDCYNQERGSLDMLIKGMTKQDRGRIVLDVHPKIFELVEKLKKEERISDTEKIFADYNDERVRQVVKTCCRHGKIKYSAVHDLRKAYVEKIERELMSKIRKDEITNSDLANRIMQQVSVKDSLNPMIKIKERRSWIDQDGNRKSYTVYKRENDEIVQERKFTYEKLINMKIENLLDLHIAENLGHSDADTVFEYRLKKTTERRTAFRKKMRSLRGKDS